LFRGFFNVFTSANTSVLIIYQTAFILGIKRTKYFAYETKLKRLTTDYEERKY